MARLSREKMRRYLWLYLMIVPVIVYFCLFVYYPMVQGVITSFHTTRLLGASEYVGLANYREVWASQDFWQTVRNTLFIGIGLLILGFFPPIVVAISLNEVSHLLFKKLAQTAVYLPHLFSWVVIGGMWMILMQPNGFVNTLLGEIGIGQVRFFTSTPVARWLMILLPIWKDMGYAAIIYLAAITAINPTLYEAARIDGASRFQQARQITAPLLIPTMKVVFMLNILGLLRIFDQIYIMRNPVIKRGVDVIMTYVYDMGILQYKQGIASAISVMVLLATLVLTAIVWTATGFAREDR